MLKTCVIARIRLSVLGAGLVAAFGLAPASAQSVPAHPHRSHHTHHRAATALPPQPSAPAPLAANATTPAPVPNEAVTPPLDPAAPSANVAPRVFQLHYPPQGEGYVTGSSPQAMDDRNAAKATGVQATVPLPQ